MDRMNTIPFQPSDSFTLGIELELQLLDPGSLDLVPRAPALLAAVPENRRDRIKPEFIRSMVELNTRICTSVADAEGFLRDLHRQTEELARDQDCLLLATSLHPFADSGQQILSSHPRYGRIMEDLQLVGRRFITQGLHVHVGMPDGETAIRVCDAIRLYLPIFLALTTSSPFFESRDTGLHSYRAKLFEALPLAGIPDHFGTWRNFQQVANLLFRTGIIKEVRDLWWDVRPHPDFGTVEVRICDLPSRFRDILAMVALIQAVVVTIANADGATEPDPNMQVLRSNKWQAARYGLQGRFVDPAGPRRLTMAGAVRELLEFARPAATALNTLPYLDTIADILDHGTSADRQRLIYAETRDFPTMMRRMREEFWT